MEGFYGKKPQYVEITAKPAKSEEEDKRHLSSVSEAQSRYILLTNDNLKDSPSPMKLGHP